MRLELEITHGDPGRYSGYAKVTIAAGVRKLAFTNATAEDVGTGMERLAEELDGQLTDEERELVLGITGDDDD